MKYPLLEHDPVCRQLEEFHEVVEDAEENNGDDVPESSAHVALREGEADRDEPLQRHGDHAVDASRQRDVDDGDRVGRDERDHPSVPVLRHQRQ